MLAYRIFKPIFASEQLQRKCKFCLLYTSDAADDIALV